MSDNQIFEAASIAVLVLYLAVLAWSVRHGKTPLLLVNMATALALGIYNSFPLRYLVSDEREMAIVAFEVLALVAALIALSGARPALLWSYAVFGVHLCISVGGVFLAFFLRITRLI